MFCPKCGNANQIPETFCRQCGIFLPDFNKLERKETPPEQHLKINTVLNLMTAVVSISLAILLHVFFTSKPSAPPLIYVTAGFLTAMFFWQAQIFWRNMLLKKHLSKRTKKENVKTKAPDTNPLGEPAKRKELL